MESIKVGNFIKENREKKGITQEELANVLHVSRTNISKWERGVRIPNSQYLQELSNYFDVSINELLLGEKLKNNDIKKYDNALLGMIDYFYKRINKISLVLVSLFLFLLILLCTVFTINNYNSIKVYLIGGHSNNYAISEGLTTISRENMYIKLGSIISNKPFDKYVLYFTENENKYNLITGNNNDITYINKFGEEQDYDYETLLKSIDNLYLDIYEVNEIETIKLETNLLFKNNKLFYTNIKSNLKSNNSIIEMNDIPKYIQENFVYDSSDNKYKLNYSKGECQYNVVYESIGETIKVFNAYEKCKDYIDTYLYDTLTDSLDYVHESLKDNKTSTSTYENIEKSDDTLVEYFLKNYYFMINE
jgi:transcriptional regulator with XRE-family HTH domain